MGESAFHKQHCDAETGICGTRFKRFQWLNALLMLEWKFEGRKQEKGLEDMD